MPDVRRSIPLVSVWQKQLMTMRLKLELQNGFGLGTVVGSLLKKKEVSTITSTPVTPAGVEQGRTGDGGKNNVDGCADLEAVKELRSVSKLLISTLAKLGGRTLRGDASRYCDDLMGIVSKAITQYTNINSSQEIQLTYEEADFLAEIDRIEELAGGNARVNVASGNDGTGGVSGSEAGGVSGSEAGGVGGAGDGSGDIGDGGKDDVGGSGGTGGAGPAGDAGVAVGGGDSITIGKSGVASEILGEGTGDDDDEPNEMDLSTLADTLINMEFIAEAKFHNEISGKGSTDGTGEFDRPKRQKSAVAFSFKSPFMAMYGEHLVGLGDLGKAVVDYAFNNGKDKE